MGYVFPSSPHVSNQRFLFAVKNRSSLSLSFPLLAGVGCHHRLMCFFSIIIIKDFCLGPVHLTQVRLSSFLFSYHHTQEKTFHMFLMCIPPFNILFLLLSLLIAYIFD